MYGLLFFSRICGNFHLLLMTNINVLNHLLSLSIIDNWLLSLSPLYSLFMSSVRDEKFNRWFQHNYYVFALLLIFGNLAFSKLF